MLFLKFESRFFYDIVKASSILRPERVVFVFLESRRQNTVYDGQN